MKIAWVQLNDLPKGRAPKEELFELICKKTSFCTEVFLFFAQFPPGERAELIKREVSDRFPRNTHVLFPVRSMANTDKEDSEDSKVKNAITLLRDQYKNNQCYSFGTVKEIADGTAEWLKRWNSEYAAKLSPVKGSFHFYCCEDFGSHDGSLFALHLNTSVSLDENGKRPLLNPNGIDEGFADKELTSLLNDSKIAVSFGEIGSSFWNEHEREQLLNILAYDSKNMFYLCDGGENTRVIPHRTSRRIFNEIQLGSESCVIGFFDFTCNTGSITHYTYDSYHLNWEKDNNFARDASSAGIMDAVIYPRLDTSLIQKGMGTEITNFAKKILNITPPAISVIDWEVDSTQANDSYLRILADAFWGEISKKSNDQEVLLYYHMCGNELIEHETKRCEPFNSLRYFIVQNSIGAPNVLPPLEFLNRNKPARYLNDNTAIIILRIHKKGDEPLPKLESILKRDGSELPVTYVSVSFAWLDHLLLVLSMFCEKYNNPEKQKESVFAISNDNSTKATQDISPTKESGSNNVLNISEKQASIDSNYQENRRGDDAEKGDDRDGR